VRQRSEGARDSRRAAPATPGRPIEGAHPLPPSIGNSAFQRVLARMPLEVFKQRVTEVVVGRSYTYDELVRHLQEHHLGNQNWLDGVIARLDAFDPALVERLIRHVIRDYRTSPDAGANDYLAAGLPVDDFSTSEHLPAAERGRDYVNAFADRRAALGQAPPGLPPVGMNPYRKGFLLHEEPLPEARAAAAERNLRCLAIRTVPDPSDRWASPGCIYAIVDPSIDVAGFKQACVATDFATGPGVYHRWLGKIVGYERPEVERYIDRQRGQEAYRVELYEVDLGEEPPDDDDGGEPSEHGSEHGSEATSESASDDGSESE
jgi:hypothetical protein